MPTLKWFNVTAGTNHQRWADAATSHKTMAERLADSEKMESTYAAEEKKSQTIFHETAGQSSVARMKAAFKATGGRITGADYDLIMKLGKSSQSGKGLVDWTNQELRDAIAGLQGGLDGPLLLLIEVVQDELDRRSPPAAAPAPSAPAPPAPPSAAPRATVNLAPEHHWNRPFSVKLLFPSDLGVSYTVVRDTGVVATGGKITRVRRVDGRSDWWEIFVTPLDDQTVELSVTSDLTLRSGEAIQAEKLARVPA